MDATMTAPETDRPTAPTRHAAPQRVRWTADTTAMAVFVALALVVTARLWLFGGSAATSDNTGDYAQFLLFFEHAASAVTNLHNPLFTTLMGAPDGVNLMANTSFLGMAVPLIPVTILAGPGVSFALALTIGLAGTAAAWYVVLRRHVTDNRGAAFVAAAFCGFAPGIVGHANGHPNLCAQFMLPLIVSAVIRLRTTTTPVKSGLILGLMITYQLFLNEELLLFTAMACGLMAIVYVASRPAQALAEARRFLVGLGVAAGVSLVLAAYFLWFQFFGPQHYRGPFTWAPHFVMDLVEYPAYGGNSVAGVLGSASFMNSDPAETNAFLGLPLCILALVAAVALWNVLAARIATVVGMVFALLSLGDTIQVGGINTHIPGPWRLLGWIPLIDSVIKPRLALVVIPPIAVLLAFVADRLLANTAAQYRWGLLAAVLVPLTPTPLPAAPPDPVPAFISDGTWRDYVDGGTVVPVAQTETEMPIRWVLASDLQMHVVTGYFIGPTSRENPVARYGAPERRTGLLLMEVAETGDVPEITEDLRAGVLGDLRYWQADVLVLPPHANADALRETVTALLDRPAEEHDGTWVWDVRDLVP